MAQQPRQAARKRRTRGHVIADLAVNHLEYHVLLCGYTLERVTHDYGIDCKLLTFDENGAVENGEVGIQVKATDHIRRVANGLAVAWRLDRRDVMAWLQEPSPVVLIMYDAQAGAAYWLYIQAHFSQMPKFNPATMGTTVTVRVPITQILDATAIRRFARFRDTAMRQRRGVIHHDDA